MLLKWDIDFVENDRPNEHWELERRILPCVLQPPYLINLVANYVCS